MRGRRRYTYEIPKNYLTSYLRQECDAQHLSYACSWHMYIRLSCGRRRHQVSGGKALDFIVFEPELNVEVSSLWHMPDLFCMSILAHWHTYCITDR